MGHVMVTVTLANPAQRARQHTLSMLVDTGATLSKVPESVLTQLDIKPEQHARHLLPGGRETLRPVGSVWMSIDGQEGRVPVSFGEEGQPPLLGVTALEILGFTVDPIDERLKPSPLLGK